VFQFVAKQARNATSGYRLSANVKMIHGIWNIIVKRGSSDDIKEEPNPARMKSEPDPARMKSEPASSPAVSPSRSKRQLTHSLSSPTGVALLYGGGPVKAEQTSQDHTKKEVIKHELVRYVYIYAWNLSYVYYMKCFFEIGGMAGAASSTWFHIYRRLSRFT
jgi:Ca2+-dependent lipid-binding protein